MPSITAQIINHTHWDREWFLTSVYTNSWIPGLIDRLVELVEVNPDFHFFLDGQTLIVEDLLRTAPHYRAQVEKLVRDGNLLVGPYYCQPDWQLTGGEALLRNLQWGRKDMHSCHGEVDTGWLVDTFGHISQAPQLHRLFGIDSVYVWRGTPQLRAYFHWRGADGSRLFTINLFGGYRNLYGVTHAPEVAVTRLLAEIHKLLPYYPTPDLPLFDGYDLEDNPEDPVRFYQDRWAELPSELRIEEATPASFAHSMRQKADGLETITGELNSGKFGAVFPGTLSSRIYLKVMARDCEHLLYQLCEPLGALARLRGRPYPAEQYEAWSRSLLQNAVHDCLCGVSIDQVHEKMEFSYRQAFEAMQADLQASLAILLEDFVPGVFAVSTNPFPYDGWHVLDGRLCHVKTQGVGAWEIVESYPIQEPGERIPSFSWKNQHYEAYLQPDGTLRVGEAVLGALNVNIEQGDTYSDENGRRLGTLRPGGPLQIIEQSGRRCVVCFACSASWEEIQVSAEVRLTFDPSPMIRWQVVLDSRGVDFQVDMLFETAQPGQIFAGMPFDVVQRAAVDRDLLPRLLDESLAAVLLGQRELGETRTFPFHDFVAMSDGSTTAAVLAKGLHAYRADENGQIAIPLRRSVDWLTKADMEHRVGDAGPFFYVPDARGERAVTHELAAVWVDGEADGPRFQALNAGFQNPPLLAQSQGAGSRREWKFFQEDLPLSALHVANGRLLARLFNPAEHAYPLSQVSLQTDVFGNPEKIVGEVPAKGILTLSLGELPVELHQAAPRPVKLYNPPLWRVGRNQGLPDPAIIQQLRIKSAQLEQEIEAAAAQLSQADGRARYHWQHRIYVLRRELLEYRLSARLNELKLGMQGQLTSDYLYKPDEEIAAIGKELNQMRILRRIYDYVVQAV